MGNLSKYTSIRDTDVYLRHCEFLVRIPMRGRLDRRHLCVGPILSSGGLITGPRPPPSGQVWRTSRKRDSQATKNWADFLEQSVVFGLGLGTLHCHPSAKQTNWLKEGTPAQRLCDATAAPWGLRLIENHSFSGCES